MNLKMYLYKKAAVLTMLIVLSLLNFSCKSVSIYQTSETRTTRQLNLGGVGLDSDFMFQTDFNNRAIPKYQEPIKVSVTVTPFNKQAYKSFTKAKKLQAANVVVNYVDSVANKPQYVKLEIADRVGVLNALNANENNDVKGYLKNTKEASVLVGLSYALNQEDITAVMAANAVFLIEKGYKTYALQLYNDGAKGKTIHFNDGIVFAFETAACCWQENTKRQLSIVDLVDKLDGCPYNTYRNAKRARKKEKKINYFKF